MSPIAIDLIHDDEVPDGCSDQWQVLQDID